MTKKAIFAPAAHAFETRGCIRHRGTLIMDTGERRAISATGDMRGINIKPPPPPTSTLHPTLPTHSKWEGGDTNFFADDDRVFGSRQPNSFITEALSRRGARAFPCRAATNNIASTSWSVPEPVQYPGFAFGLWHICMPPRRYANPISLAVKRITLPSPPRAKRDHDPGLKTTLFVNEIVVAVVVACPQGLPMPMSAPGREQTLGDDPQSRTTQDK